MQTFEPDERITLLSGEVVDAELIHYFESGFRYGQVYWTADGRVHHCGRDRKELEGYEYENAHSPFAPGEPWRTHTESCPVCGNP